VPKVEALDDGQADLLHLSGLSWPYPHVQSDIQHRAGQAVAQLRLWGLDNDIARDLAIWLAARDTPAGQPEDQTTSETGPSA
jgi:hypothetical protein